MYISAMFEQCHLYCHWHQLHMYLSTRLFRCTMRVDFANAMYSQLCQQWHLCHTWTWQCTNLYLSHGLHRFALRNSSVSLFAIALCKQWFVFAEHGRKRNLELHLCLSSPLHRSLVRFDFTCWNKREEENTKERVDRSFRTYLCHIHTIDMWQSQLFERWHMFHQW
jgi:hypothetical protein